MKENYHNSIITPSKYMKAPYKHPLAKAYITICVITSLGCGISKYAAFKEISTDGTLAIFEMLFTMSLVLGISYLAYLATIYYVYPKLTSRITKNSNVECESGCNDAHNSHFEDDMLEQIEFYASKTFENHLSENEMDTLIANIECLSQDKELEGAIVHRLAGITSNDIYHFGWNIGKRLHKTNIEIAWFLKGTFKQMLEDISIDTVQTKLAIKEGTFSLKLIPLGNDLVPHKFPILRA